MTTPASKHQRQQLPAEFAVESHLPKTPKSGSMESLNSMKFSNIPRYTSPRLSSSGGGGSHHKPKADFIDSLVKTTKEIQNLSAAFDEHLTINGNAHNNGNDSVAVLQGVPGTSTYTDSALAVMRHIEATLSTARTDPIASFETLKDFIVSDDRALSTGSLNLLLKIVELHRERVPELLPTMIPVLLKVCSSF